MLPYISPENLTDSSRGNGMLSIKRKVRKYSPVLTEGAYVVFTVRNLIPFTRLHNDR